MRGRLPDGGEGGEEEEEEEVEEEEEEVVVQSVGAVGERERLPSLS